MANLDKLMFLFYGKQATGPLSFAPGMDHGDINLNKGIESIDIDAEGAGDSDKTGDDGGDEEHDGNTMLPENQSRSLLLSGHTFEKKAEK